MEVLFRSYLVQSAASWTFKSKHPQESSLLIDITIRHIQQARRIPFQLSSLENGPTTFVNTR